MHACVSVYIHSEHLKPQEFYLISILHNMVHVVSTSLKDTCLIENDASKVVAKDGIKMEDLSTKYSMTPIQRTSISDDESGFSDTQEMSSCMSPIQTITKYDYEIASNLPDESKKEFCSDMCFIFHAEFQLTFGQYFPSDQWILMPLFIVDTCKLPTNTLCDVELAKVRFECDSCGHCWTSMRGQISFFYNYQSHILYFKLFTQNCDHCGKASTPLWYPEEVRRVIRNVFVIVQREAYPNIKIPIEANHFRRRGNPKGQHHGCESCREGVCVSLAAQQLGCKLVG